MNGVIADTVTLNTWRSLLSTLSYKSLICFNGVFWALVKASTPLAVHLSRSHTLSIVFLSLFSPSPCPPIPLNLTCTVSLNYSLSARRTVLKEQAQCRVSGLNVKVFPYQVCIHSHNELRSLSCFSVRRVQTRPLFSTSSDATFFFPVLLEQRLESSHHTGLKWLSLAALCKQGENHIMSSNWPSGSIIHLTSCFWIAYKYHIIHTKKKCFSNCDMNMYFRHGTMAIIGFCFMVYIELGITIWYWILPQRPVFYYIKYLFCSHLILFIYKLGFSFFSALVHFKVSRFWGFF